MVENSAKRMFPIQTYLRPSLNNQELSDVCFVVGKQKSKIYANKFLMSIASPVFKAMFYSDLKETNYEVEIPDLTHEGFMNFLKYIYGYGIDFDNSELLETLIVANKYLILNFADDLFEYMKEQLNVSNCCLIYDHLLKINEENQSLEYVKKMITDNAREIFESNHFVRISQNTLVNLLNLQALKIYEIDLLRACSKWIDNQLVESGLDLNAENKQNLFNSIKHLIRFTDITAKEIADFKEIKSLLSNEEIENLFLHLINKNNGLKIECKTLRGYGNHIFSVFSVPSKYVDTIFTGTNHLKVNHRVRIRRIYSTISNKVLNYELTICDSTHPLIGNLKLDIESVVINGKWCFNFKDGFVCEPYKQYYLEFFHTAPWRTDFKEKLSQARDLKLNRNGKEIIFYLTSKKISYHSIRRIDFFIDLN